MTEVLEAINPHVRVTETRGGWRIEGYGGKGGGSTHTPTEAPDSLHSISRARTLDLLGVGEWEGPVHGMPSLLRDITLDGTPIANEDGSLNFENVIVDIRLGTQDQDYIKGFPASEVSSSVGIELRAGTPWTHAITNLELSAVRVSISVNGLTKVNTSNGDIKGYRIEYIVELSTDGGSYQTIVDGAFDGKTTSTYTRTHRIDLPNASIGWQLRVRRITANADSATISDTTVIADYTEVIDAKFRVPMGVLIGIQVDAKQFQTIPVRGYNFKRKKIKIPSNYDPDTRIYSGTWDGTFQTAYSNNPAWCYYELLTNSLYGCGDIIPSAWIDKWSLYAIAQYCDELVSDGKGGFEPRFTCNVYIQQQVEAWKLIQDLASVFRGITYYMGGSIGVVANAPRDPVYIYTPANVIGGKFSGAGSSRTTRNTVALVSWNDQTDMGRAKVEVVEDRDGVLRYGLRQTSVTAFACSSQGQAQRLGKFLLLTALLETQAKKWQVGLDGTIAMPGQIVQIADPNFAGRRNGGRIISAGIDYIVVDAPVSARFGDNITITLSNGITETRMISAAIGGALTVDSTEYTVDSTELTADMMGLYSNVVNIYVTENFSEIPEPETIWALNTSDLKTQTYCITSVTDKGNNIYEIAGVQYVVEKFAAIDSGTKIQLPPTTVIPPVVQSSPTNVQISSYSVITQNQAIHNAAITFDKAENAVSYRAQWKRDNSDWVNVPGETGATRIELQNVLAGQYLVRVLAINASGISSAWATSETTEIDGLLDAPASVTSLTATSKVFAIELNWGFPDTANIIERTELYYSFTNDFETATKLADFAYPQNTHNLLGLASGASFYFWAVLVDKNGLSGARYPAGGGIHGTASADASAILDYLTGEITSSQLNTALEARIETGENAAVSVEALTTATSAMYTIKTQFMVDGTPYMAGIGVGVENDEGILTSQIILSASRVVILDETSGSEIAPFVVTGGIVYINGAYINSLSANKISTGTLSVGVTVGVAGKILLDGVNNRIVVSD